MMKRGALVVPAALASLLAACADGDQGAAAPHTTVPAGTAYFDAYEEAASALTPTSGFLTGTATALEAKRGTPRFVWGNGASAPPVAELMARSTSRSRAPSPAAAAALWHLRQNAAAYGLSPEA